MTPITVETIITSDLKTIWDCFTTPAHIEKWNHASFDWECPYAENDLRVDGSFLYTMSALDGSSSFDFTGTYTAVIAFEKIAYKITGGRKVEVTFTPLSLSTVRVSETFDPETENSIDMQRTGWQSILDAFKQHVESVT